MATNTTKSMTTKKVTNAELEAQIKKAGAEFAKEKLVNFSVPKALKSQIGNHLPIGINGSWIVVAVNGEDHPIPESFAQHGKEYLKNFN